MTLRLFHKVEIFTYEKRVINSELLFLEFEKQISFKAVIKEELVEDTVIINNYFMTMAMNYVLSKFFVLMAHHEYVRCCR